MLSCVFRLLVLSLPPFCALPLFAHPIRGTGRGRLPLLRAVSSCSPLVRYGRRVVRTASSSRRRRLCHPWVCGLASRPSDKGNGAIIAPGAIHLRAVSMAAGRRSIRGGCFFILIGIVPVRMRRFVLLFALSDMGNGAGACLLSLVPLFIR